MPYNSNYPILSKIFDPLTFKSYGIGLDSFWEDLGLAFKNSYSNYPPYNILKVDDKNYEIQIAAAGFKEDELTISSTNQDLTILGAKAESTENQNFICKGLAARSFELNFVLGRNVEVKEASFESGILTVKVTDTKKDSTKRIPIKKSK